MFRATHLTRWSDKCVRFSGARQYQESMCLLEEKQKLENIFHTVVAAFSDWPEETSLLKISMHMNSRI